MASAPRASIPAALLLGASLALVGASTPQSVPQADLDSVLQRVGRYVEQYQQEFSRLVCGELFTQTFRQRAYVEKRWLVSEFALARIEHGGQWLWQGYRNVLAVDGVPLWRARNRLEALFSSSPADLRDRAQAIADEGARYNLGQYRTINVPTLALEYLASSFQMRTWYTKAGEETVSGVRAWRIAFEEIAVPTVIRTPEGNDVPAKGIAWVEPGTGRVVRTQLEPQQPATLAAESILNKLTKPGPRKPEPRQESRIIVTYAPDSRFGVWVPLKLEESYKRAQVTVTGEAAYSDCRRFETTARVKNEDE